MATPNFEIKEEPGTDGLFQVYQDGVYIPNPNNSNMKLYHAMGWCEALRIKHLRETKIK